MNVLICSNEFQYCAKYLDDKRLNKMCLETVQILSTILRNKGHNVGYKSTHKNHPIIRHYNDNLDVILALCREYFIEYHKRFNKIHKSSLVYNEIVQNVKLYYNNNYTYYNLAANKSLNINYTDIKDVITAYQLYLVHRWLTDKRKPKWYGFELDPKKIFKNLNLTQLKI